MKLRSFSELLWNFYDEKHVSFISTEAAAKHRYMYVDEKTKHGFLTSATSWTLYN